MDLSSNALGETVSSRPISASSSADNRQARKRGTASRACMSGPSLVKDGAGDTDERKATVGMGELEEDILKEPMDVVSSQAKRMKTGSGDVIGTEGAP